MAVVNPDQYTLAKTTYRRYTTPFADILSHSYSGSGTQEDPYLVEWLPKDHENPQTWSAVYKWAQTIQVAIATLSVALASSAYSGAVDSLQAQFHPTKQIILTLGISLFVLGFAFGPLFWAPFSEVVGRRNLFIFTSAVFTLWQAVSPASPNMASLIVFRFLAGFFGSSPLVNTGGTLADMFDAKQRGLAMAIFASAPFLGPALGPIIGGFLGETQGWKWVIGFLAIFSGVITIIGAASLPETYAPVLLRWRAQKLSKVTGKDYICKLDKGRDLSLKTQFKTALGRTLVAVGLRAHRQLAVNLHCCHIWNFVFSVRSVPHRLPTSSWMEPRYWRSRLSRCTGGNARCARLHHLFRKPSIRESP